VKYVIGHDRAYGLSTRDFDAAVALDRQTGAQVAEAMRHRGDRHVDRRWRRGESNPRPEITRMAASTCLVDVLISIIATSIDTLRHDPVV
jgi:hypothetical protein